MTGREFLAIGLAVWAGVFLLLLVALAIEADVEKRWNEDWAFGWEQARGKPIDELIETLARQHAAWRRARSILSWYVLLALGLIGAAAFVQWQHEVMLPDTFERAMLLGAAVLALLALPARVVAEIGTGIVEAMHRQARFAAGERIVIHSKEELYALPKPGKPGKKKEPAAAGEAPAPQ